MVEICISILSGFCVSVVFLLFMSKFRPKIIISDKIAKGKDSRGKTVYRIKVINKTCSSIINVKAQLHIVKPTKTTDGQIDKSTEIELKQNEIMALSRFNKNDNYAEYAYRFSFENEKIEKEDFFNDGTLLRFRIYATHSFSGFGKLFRQDYDRESILSGTFETRNSFKIN